MKLRVLPVTVAMTLAVGIGTGTGIAAEPASVCLSAGSRTDGVTAMIHHADDRSVRVDSPFPDDPNSRIQRWSEQGYFQAFWAAVEPVLPELPEDALAACDDGWRDTLVVTYADGSVLRRDASCMGNAVFGLRNRLAMTLPSFVENETEERPEGAVEGVYDP